jgi:hypothetical protein
VKKGRKMKGRKGGREGFTAFTTFNSFLHFLSSFTSFTSLGRKKGRKGPAGRVHGAVQDDDRGKKRHDQKVVHEDEGPHEQPKVTHGSDPGCAVAQEGRTCFFFPWY